MKRGKGVRLHVCTQNRGGTHTILIINVRPEFLICSKAEKLTGISQQQVSRWRPRLGDVNAYCVPLDFGANGANGGLNS